MGQRPGSEAIASKKLVDARTADSTAPPSAAFTPIRRIGGGTGWYFGNCLWRLRGLIDLLCGGIVAAGPRDSESLRVGDTVDRWRVEAFEPDRRLLLHEMKLPGGAWLEFDVEPTPSGSRIRQTAVFEASGFAGRVYWYLIHPLHQRVFAGMLQGIVASGLEASRQITSPRSPLHDGKAIPVAANGQALGSE